MYVDEECVNFEFCIFMILLMEVLEVLIFFSYYLLSDGYVEVFLSLDNYFLVYRIVYDFGYDMS